jgi:hypothetical protein
MIMTSLRSSSVLALTFLAAVVSPLILGAQPASARVNVGIDVGIPAIVAPVPYYAPPPVVYAQPEPVYAAPPPVVYAPGPVVAVGGGYWAYDSFGHRYWRHRR